MLGEGLTSSSVSSAIEGHVCSHDLSSDSDPVEVEHYSIPSINSSLTVLVFWTDVQRLIF
jgi:hypothetical protein